MEGYSLCIVLGELPETMQKLLLSTKFPHKQIREITVFFAVLAIWEAFSYESSFSYDSYKFSYNFAFIPLFHFIKTKNKNQFWSRVAGLVKKYISAFVYSESRSTSEASRIQ